MEKMNAEYSSVAVSLKDDLEVRVPIMVEPTVGSVEREPVSFSAFPAQAVPKLSSRRLPSMGSFKRDRCLAKGRVPSMELVQKKRSEMGLRRNMLQLLNCARPQGAPSIDSTDDDGDFIIRNKGFQSLAIFEQRCQRNKRLRDMMMKVQSVRKGLYHISTCSGCDKMLCQSTRKLVERVKQHQCQPGVEAAACRACIFWHTLAMLHRKDCLSEGSCIVPNCKSAPSDSHLSHHNCH